MKLPPVDVVRTKWGGRQHWEQRSQYLGENGHGRWIGCRVGQVVARPGLAVAVPCPMVMLAPPGAFWLASFRGHVDPPHAERAEIYVDVTGPVAWSADLSRVTAVDLDLDVLRLWDGTVIVDDEDEFEQHRVEFGYPDDVVAGARRTCQELVTAVRDGSGPFGGAHRDWLARVTATRSG